MTRSVALLAPLLLLVLPQCVAHEHGDRLSRHASAEVWLGGLEQQILEPGQWIPEAGLLAASLALIPYDDRIVDDARDDPDITGGTRNKGDTVALALGGVTAGYGVWQWVGGDEAMFLETLGETWLVTGLTTELLKATTDRWRPSRQRRSHASFPSGHTSMTFAAATVLGRHVDDLGDEWYTKLGYLAYVPAIWVGINRVESSRHFPTDVTAGALIGMFTANWFYNAHYGSHGHDLPGIFDRKEPEVSVVPMVGVERLGLALQVVF